MLIPLRQKGTLSVIKKRTPPIPSCASANFPFTTAAAGPSGPDDDIVKDTHPGVYDGETCNFAMFLPILTETVQGFERRMVLASVKMLCRCIFRMLPTLAILWISKKNKAAGLQHKDV